MSVAAMLGVDDLDGPMMMTARSRWPRWQVDEPALAPVGDLLDLPTWTGTATPDAKDAALRALAKLGAPDGENNEAATTALVCPVRRIWRPGCPSEWVTGTEAAHILGLSKTRVWQLALKDLLPLGVRSQRPATVSACRGQTHGSGSDFIQTSISPSVTRLVTSPDCARTGSASASRWEGQGHASITLQPRHSSPAWNGKYVHDTTSRPSPKPERSCSTGATSSTTTAGDTPAQQ